MPQSWKKKEATNAYSVDCAIDAGKSDDDYDCEDSKRRPRTLDADGGDECCQRTTRGERRAMVAGDGGDDGLLATGTHPPPRVMLQSIKSPFTTKLSLRPFTRLVNEPRHRRAVGALLPAVNGRDSKP